MVAAMHVCVGANPAPEQGLYPPGDWCHRHRHRHRQSERAGASQAEFPVTLNTVATPKDSCLRASA